MPTTIVGIGAIAHANPKPQPSFQLAQESRCQVNLGDLNVFESATATTPTGITLPAGTPVTPTPNREGDRVEISAPVSGWVDASSLTPACGSSPVTPTPPPVSLNLMVYSCGLVTGITRSLPVRNSRDLTAPIVAELEPGTSVVLAQEGSGDPQTVLWRRLIRPNEANGQALTGQEWWITEAANGRYHVISSNCVRSPYTADDQRPRVGRPFPTQ